MNYQMHIYCIFDPMVSNTNRKEQRQDIRLSPYVKCEDERITVIILIGQTPVYDPRI